jgi:hypothetical protein
MPYEKALLELALAGSDGLAVERRKEHLTSARSAFERMGNAYDVGRCAELASLL